MLVLVAVIQRCQIQHLITNAQKLGIVSGATGITGTGAVLG